MRASWAFGCMYRRERFGRFPPGTPGFTRRRRIEVQIHLGARLPHVVPEIQVLLTSPSRSGLQSSFPARPILFLRLSALECLTSGEPGRWSGQNRKGTCVGQACSASWDGASGNGSKPVWQWRVVRTPITSVVPSSVRRTVVNSWRSQLIPFGRVSSIARLGRCLQLRKRAISEKDRDW
jgi:hypothetical protein